MSGLVQWVFEDRDRATGVLLGLLSLLVLIGHYGLQALSFRRDAKVQEFDAHSDAAIKVTLEVDASQAIASFERAAEATRLIPMQKVTNGEDLLGGGLR